MILDETRCCICIYFSGYPDFRIEGVEKVSWIAIGSRRLLFDFFRHKFNPHLENRAQDDPDAVEAQQELAKIQKRARAIVTESYIVKSV